jgi:hypothetical protein
VMSSTPVSSSIASSSRPQSPSSQNRTLLEVEHKALIRLVIEAVLAKLNGQLLLRRRAMGPYRVAEVPISWQEHADSLVSCLLHRCRPR